MTEHHKVNQLISARPLPRITAPQRLQTATRQEILDHYGIQATSLAHNLIGEFWRPLRPYLQYDLPPDFPVDSPLPVEVSVQPRRFLFVPNASGVQLIGSLNHQPQAESGRPFTFHAHVLFNKKMPRTSETDWTASKAMQLFNWDWKDRKSDTYRDMETLNTLPTDLPQAVNERLLQLFITTENAADFEAEPNGHLIPRRWRAMTAKVRRSHLRKVLRCAMESCVAKPRSALILCEPEIAIVFFYCIARLIPSSILGNASFSTYEPNFKKRFPIQIAATSFHKPNANTFTKYVTSEVLRRQFVVNTFNGQSSPEIQNSQFISYVNHTINLIKTHGWSQANKLLLVFTSLKPKTVNNIRQLIVGEGTFQALVNKGTHEIPTKFISNAKPLVQNIVRLRLVDYFSVNPSNAALTAISSDEIKHELFFHLLANTDSYATVQAIVDPSIAGTKLALANKIVSSTGRLKYDPLFLAKMIAWRFLNTKEPLTILSELFEQQLEQQLNSITNTNAPLLTLAIALMDDCTTAFDELFVRGLDDDNSRIGLLFGLLAQDSNEPDLHQLRENHYLWLSSDAQEHFVRLCDFEKMPEGFNEFLAISIAKQIDPYTNPQSIFHRTTGFNERVKTFIKCKSMLDPEAQVHLEQARVLVGLFQETVRHRSSGLLGRGPFRKLLVHLEAIYKPTINKDSVSWSQEDQLARAVKNAALILNELNNTNASLDSILMNKWDILLYDHFHSE